MDGEGHSAQAALESLLPLPIGEALGEAALAELAAIGRLVDHPAQAVLCAHGDAAEALQVLLSGRVSLTLEVPGRAAMTVAALSRGDVLGWSALSGWAATSTWTMTARVTKACRCLVLPGAALRELCERDHELGFHLMRYAFEVVAQRLEDARVQMLDMYGESA
ncbi:MAG: cyclic nucleotide-binding domain-containing protein [Nannocystaceae bacterium]